VNGKCLPCCGFDIWNVFWLWVPGSFAETEREGNHLQGKQGLKNMDQDLLGTGKQMVEVWWIYFWPGASLCASAT